MDVSVALTLVQTILQLLDSPISKRIFGEIKSLWGYKSQLQKLKNTMSTIQDMLTHVERLESQQLPISISQVTLQRLEDAVYEAHDLFDEISTAAHLKELMTGNSFSKEVRLFFSRFNQLSHTFTKSREIKKIRGILDDIAKDHRDFGALIPPPNNVGIRNIDPSRETHSFVCEEDVIIGRDEDKRVVINMLLHTSVEENVSVVSIVGIGGLGKTTLAKLVYNDDIIQTEFSLKMWVCVSDDFNVRSLLGQILAAATQETNNSGLNKDQLQTKLRQELSAKKYLLVLDDVWNEDPIEWNELRNILIQGGRDSKIIVTTRSREVAKIVGSEHQAHELKGLSEEDSWNLFERMTLGPGQLRMEAHLVEIGKDIVRKCVNVPLAIRVIGSLLRGQGDSMWRYLRNTDLAKIKIDEKGGIIPVLKISYHHLPLHLKSCFSYCAVFPKDYQIQKDDLVDQWMAHGFIVPSGEQSLEDLGDIYFHKLLQRCFFQDVKRDLTTGDIFSCKMHDLVHDLAKEVCRIGNDVGSLQDDKTRHIFIDRTLVEMEDVEMYLAKMKRLRTYLLGLYRCSDFYMQFPFKMRYLRVLGLRERHLNVSVKRLPSMIGELLHLRYLELYCYRELRVLPNSITLLHNLQTLKLIHCENLIELPRELRKLVNLRHLDMQGCNSLGYMPGGMNSMTSLHRLTRFVLGDVTSNAATGGVGKLEDLKHLNNLRGILQVVMKGGWRYDGEKVKEGGYLINKPLVNTISIDWIEMPCNDAEALLQGLQPHPNIKQLKLAGYPGVGLSRWGNYSSLSFSESLPNLVKIGLCGCERLESLPLFSQLRHLKLLQLRDMEKLEYVESSSSSSSSRRSSRSGDDELVFFPSLTVLELWDLPELKGWWKTSTSTSTSTSGEGDEIGRGDNNNQLQEEEAASLFLGFPCLSKLWIYSCDKLTTIPGFPKLNQLDLNGSGTLLEHLHLHSLPRESFQHLSRMRIENDHKMETLSTLEVFRSGRLSSLRSLQITRCSKLKSISGRGVWEHFTALKTLQLVLLPELELELEDNGNSGGDDDMPWRWVAPTLRHLELRELSKMVKMPKGMQHLTSLHSLYIDFPNTEEIPGWIGCLSSLQQLTIRNCKRVKSLPEEMRHLTCLTNLTLRYCSLELEERCKEPNGVDWPKIKHIPNTVIY